MTEFKKAGLPSLNKWVVKRLTLSTTSSIDAVDILMRECPYFGTRLSLAEIRARMCVQVDKGKFHEWEMRRWDGANITADDERNLVFMAASQVPGYLANKMKYTGSREWLRGVDREIKAIEEDKEKDNQMMKSAEEEMLNKRPREEE